MSNYHKAEFWDSLAKNFSAAPPSFNEVLFLANLVIQDPISWWTKRALRKAVCALIAEDPQACIHQILISGSDSSRDLAWRGLTHDKPIMLCFRTHLKVEAHYKQLLALAETSSKRTGKK